MDQRCHTFSFGHYHQAPSQIEWNLKVKSEISVDSYNTKDVATIEMFGN